MATIREPDGAPLVGAGQIVGSDGTSTTAHYRLQRFKSVDVRRAWGSDELQRTDIGFETWDADITGKLTQDNFGWINEQRPLELWLHLAGNRQRIQVFVTGSSALDEQISFRVTGGMCDVVV